MVENVNENGSLGLHVGVAAFVEIELISIKVPFGCQVQLHSPESISLAVRVGENVFIATDSVESELFGHCYDFYLLIINLIYESLLIK